MSVFFKLVIMLSICQISRSFCMNKAWRSSKLVSSSSRLSNGAQIEIDPTLVPPAPETDDICMSGLNGDQDVLVRVISCRELVQEVMLKNDLTPQAAQPLGELMVGGLMMGGTYRKRQRIAAPRFSYSP